MFLHFIQVAPEGVATVEFGVDMTGIVGWNYIDSNVNWPTYVGDFNSEIAISFESCQEGNIYLGYAVYLTQSPATPPCTHIQIIGHSIYFPNFFAPVTARCADPYPMPLETGSGYAVVNPLVGCHCVDVVPVEESSWGQIKSLYQ